MAQLSHVGFTGALAPLRPARRNSIIANASAEGPQQGPPKPQSVSPASKSAKEIKLPKSGYFSLADPNAEIYSKATEPFDPRKKGGRWKNEFIWNTNWQVGPGKAADTSPHRMPACKPHPPITPMPFGAAPACPHARQ